jgi:hypothetical protein
MLGYKVSKPLTDFNFNCLRSLTSWRVQWRSGTDSRGVDGAVFYLTRVSMSDSVNNALLSISIHRPNSRVGADCDTLRIQRDATPSFMLGTDFMAIADTEEAS